MDAPPPPPPPVHRGPGSRALNAEVGRCADNYARYAEAGGGAEAWQMFVDGPFTRCLRCRHYVFGSESAERYGRRAAIITGCSRCTRSFCA